jgi:hypothetical protein
MNEAFGQILLEAIDEALLSLGESVKFSIYYHLERKFQINRQDIPSRIEDFSDALEQIFGVAARNLEILFMKNLHSKIGELRELSAISCVFPEMTFREYVDFMHQNFERTGLQEVKIGLIADEREKQEMYLG